ISISEIRADKSELAVVCAIREKLEMPAEKTQRKTSVTKKRKTENREYIRFERSRKQTEL
ncbi:MAG TPA: hypothetical protein DDZ36_09240, partial [Deltaproteobacteria bacterium]|nr:hypothetical protein [Deltaproteobacteria bacterium]